MNNLNSILIEGQVSNNICPVEEDGVKRCSFVLSSMRRFKNDAGDVEAQETRVWCMVRNRDREKGLADTVIKNAYDGRGLRVVGRIACDPDDNAVYIEVEHVEFRPELGKEG
jgi:hypothetical protein